MGVKFISLGFIIYFIHFPKKGMKTFKVDTYKVFCIPGEQNKCLFTLVGIEMLK